MSNGDYAVEVLLDEQIVTQEQVEKARQLAAQNRIPLVQALRELNYIDGSTVAKAIAEHLGYEYVDLSTIEIKRNVLKTVPHSEARRYRAIPVDMHDNTVVVAVADPMNLNVLDNLRHVLKTAVEPVVAIDIKPTGIPASAKTNAASNPPASCVSGAMVQINEERGGRRRSVVSSPAMTLAISTA